MYVTDWMNAEINLGPVSTSGYFQLATTRGYQPPSQLSFCPLEPCSATCWLGPAPSIWLDRAWQQPQAIHSIALFNHLTRLGLHISQSFHLHFETCIK